MTTKLSDLQKSVIHLINRSPADKDGWCRCSSVVFEQLVKRYMPNELIEVREENQQIFVRYTEAGKAVSKYVA